MRIVFYSTNSNYFDEQNYLITNLPSNFSKIDSFIKMHPKDQIYFVTQKPGMFILDNFFNKTESENIIILKEDDTDKIVDFIKNLNPDIAIALSFWVTPFDWLVIKDSLIAEKLKQIGINTICHDLSTSMICFDKYKTHIFLEKNNFRTPKALFVQHDLYFCAGNRREIKYNIYKESILEQIKKMNFPLIVKDNVGLSSYGMQILNTFGEACNYLNSKKNNSDRIIEEYIQGSHFGLEIYGQNQKYTVFDPFIFSVNQYGITSPKQSIKLGPVESSKYKIKQLKKEIIRLAKLMNFCGVAQIDLIFNGKKWYILEINPRLSGMTTTYAASKNILVYNLFYNKFIEKKKLNKSQSCINIKMKLLTQEQLQKLKELSFVKSICQTEDKNAKQDREMGFCEILITAPSFLQLKRNLENLHSTYKELMEESFYKKSLEMIDNL